MCLSVPAKVLSIDGDMARVAVGETICNASLQIVDDIRVGDYILLHTGFALQKISEEEAMETLRLFKELEDLDKRMDQEEGRPGV
ncbi:MAG: HypC/HybG/HupF family hydrogenase formation chaperone [Bacteroidales bacterium]|nr:MAG: HypC/HybG/HupF family hydrogenase formation chaperone [Bacteroidales bacterium]